MVNYPPQTYIIKVSAAEYELEQRINSYHGHRLVNWPEYMLTEIVQFTVLPDRISGYIAFILFKVEYVGEVQKYNSASNTDC